MTDAQTQPDDRPGAAARAAAQVTYARRRARRYLRDMAAMPDAAWSGPASTRAVHAALLEIANSIPIENVQKRAAK